MRTFSQKWCVVSFLEPVALGLEFGWKDWPLHVTLMGPFAANTNALDALFIELKQVKQFTIVAEGEEYWGEHGEYHVQKFQRSPEIIGLHKNILKTLTSKGAVVNDRQYVGNGYLPHSTIQKHARIYEGEEVKISRASIFEMFPGGDGYNRKVIKTVKFQ